MSGKTRLGLISAWLGIAFAGLFLYPLAAAVDADPYYMQWQPRHAVEAAAAFGGLAVACGLLVFRLWGRPSRRGSLALFLVALLPLLSFGAGVSRQLPIDDWLREVWESRLVRVAVPGTTVILLAYGFAYQPMLFGRWLRRMLLMLSPVWLVTAEALAGSMGHPGPPVAVDRVRPALTSQQGACSSVLALLFDELSFSYLYGDSPEVSEEFPQIRRLAGAATNYLDVSAPGPETLVSVPGFLAGRRFDDIRVEGSRLVAFSQDGSPSPFSATEPTGLFATARRMGFDSEAAGYYFSYCDLLGSLVDTCRSFSFYNVSTLEDRFSPLHPLLTTLILWPRQFPLGLLKNPSFGALQHRLVERTAAFARRPMDQTRPVFRFVHFSIPHLPFVFDEHGYNPPWDPLRQRPDTWYVHQLHYVDGLVGDLVEGMRRTGSFDRTTVVLLSDHGFRSGGRERNQLHIPFIVKQAGQQARSEVREPARGELLLRQIVEGSCER